MSAVGRQCLQPSESFEVESLSACETLKALFGVTRYPSNHKTSRTRALTGDSAIGNERKELSPKGPKIEKIQDLEIFKRD